MDDEDFEEMVGEMELGPGEDELRSVAGDH